AWRIRPRSSAGPSARSAGAARRADRPPGREVRSVLHPGGAFCSYLRFPVPLADPARPNWVAFPTLEVDFATQNGTRAVPRPRVTRGCNFGPRSARERLQSSSHLQDRGPRERPVGEVAERLGGLLEGADAGRRPDGDARGCGEELPAVPACVCGDAAQRPLLEQ